MLEQIPDSMDKLEGSIIFDALSPAAIEMAQMYSELDVFLGLTFADTATGDYLTRRADEYGVYRKLATFSVWKGVFTDTNAQPLDVPIGSRYSFNGLVFVATEQIQLGQFKMVSETPGAIGNVGQGDVLPIEFIDNLGTAEFTELLVPGEDEETDEALRSRLVTRVQKQGTSGNVYQYEQWALSVAGVGAVKVLPLWNGNGTVKLVLIDLDKTAPSSNVVIDVEVYVDSVKPIGATVTVIGASELPINLSATIILANGYLIQDVVDQVSSGLTTYLKSIAFTGEIVRYTRIANILLDSPSIIDYSNLLVNGGTANVQQTMEEVAVLGTVTFSE